MVLFMKIPQTPLSSRAVEVCQILSDAGFQAFLVGGCVRDWFLGQSPKDYDITTDATPEQVMSLFPKTIPTGLQHGTVTVVMGIGVENHFEVTTFRVEGEYLDGRRPEEVVFVKDIVQDLARRDLTINAMAYDPINNKLVDPFGGAEDLTSRWIRAVGVPQERFEEDGLRLMRAARFAARFNYEIEGKTLTGMINSVHNLENVSKERILDELSKTLMTKHPSAGLYIMQSTGVLKIACPLLSAEPATLSFLYSQDYCTGELETRFAFLYSCIGSYESIQTELTNLRMSTRSIKKILFLTLLANFFMMNYDEWNEKKYVELLAKIKNNSIDPWEDTLEQFMKMTEAMHWDTREIFENHKHVQVFSRKELQINGNDLLTLGVPPGPEIKSVLDRCYAEVLKHPEHNEKEFLLRFATENP